MSETLPRGVRLNNPGNIRHGSPWNGLSATQSDPKFCQFDDVKFGIRALGIILTNYQEVHHLDTVRGIINRWAPPADDNDTSAYVGDVAGRIGVDPGCIIDVTDFDTLKPLVAAIIGHECDDYAYPDAELEAGLAMAGVSTAGATS